MPASVALHPAAKPRDRSIEARGAARRAKFERERLIVDFLNRGVSVAEIAQRIDVTEKRARALVKEILARRMPAAPEDFAALQLSRLNEALLVAYGAMSAENLRAVGLVVRIVRELDRYHGFAAPDQRPRRDPRPVHAGAEEPPERRALLPHIVGKSLPPGADPGVSGDPRTLIRGRPMGCGEQECDGEGGLRQVVQACQHRSSGPHPIRPAPPATFPSKLGKWRASSVRDGRRPQRAARQSPGNGAASA